MLLFYEIGVVFFDYIKLKFLPVRARRNADVLLEYPAEIERIVIADVVGDIVDTHICLGEKIFCLRHSDVQEVLIRRYPELLRKQMDKIRNTDIEHLRVLGNVRIL